MIRLDNIQNHALKKRVEAYEYLSNHKDGTKSDIESEITPKLFEEFCRIGYVQAGMDGNWNERWQITDFGESQIKAYRKFLDKERELDDLLVRYGIA